MTEVRFAVTVLQILALAVSWGAAAALLLIAAAGVVWIVVAAAAACIFGARSTRDGDRPKW